MEKKSASSYVDILVPFPVSKLYTYCLCPAQNATLGSYVKIQWGGKTCVGVVWHHHQQAPDYECHGVLDVSDVPPLSQVNRDFVQRVARYTLSSLGSVLKMVISMPDALFSPSSSIQYGLCDGGAQGVKSTALRERVWQTLSQAQGTMSKEDLCQRAKVGGHVIDALVKSGGLVKKKVPHLWPLSQGQMGENSPALSPQQSQAAQVIESGFEKKDYQCFFLDGVTGSGKTHVYFQAILKALRGGKQVLVLLPEIGLSAQWVKRCEEDFGWKPALWHSQMSQGQRLRLWRGVSQGRARLIIGARSALFLPFKDLGLIVVDEEHDGAFKQEDGVCYHGRDMAVLRAFLGSIPIVLVSATPSLETWHNIQKKKYHHVTLTQRYAQARYPQVILVDLRKEKKQSGRWLSPTLVAGMQKTLDASQQCLLFLNRKGYAPLMLCRRCGHRVSCLHCSSCLVAYRQKGCLQCHHCGFSRPIVDVCPECEGKDTLHACGPGVERIEEEVRQYFPDHHVHVVTSDTLTHPQQAKELVEKMEKHHIDILIGTQILAKGFHFPKLTFVGIVDADLGVSGGDLRAGEKSYQVLHQVAGRSGRGELSGQVMIQTCMPDHSLMQALASYDRQRFMHQELASRAAMNMPPFGRLGAVILSCQNEKMVHDMSEKMASLLPPMDHVQALGPAPAPLFQLRGRYRYRFLICAPHWQALHDFMNLWLGQLSVPSQVRLKIDMDPYQFL